MFEALMLFILKVEIIGDCVLPRRVLGLDQSSLITV